MKKKKIILIIILLIVAILLAGLIVIKNKDNKQDEVVVQTNERDETKEQVEITNDYINIKSENDSQSEAVGKVYKGEIYTVLETLEDEYYVWCKIETTNGIAGYIAVKYQEESYVNYLEVKESQEEDAATEE